MQKTSPMDIILWLLLAAIWSSSYTVIKIGVATLAPSILVASRMLAGSIGIYAVLKMRGQSLSRNPADWGAYAITGLFGSALPFLLITYGEQSVDSALAAILMGATPVITVLLIAWLIPQETLTPRHAIGVIGGVVGVAILVGPTALSGLGAQISGQAAIIAATVCYAGTTIFVRRFVTRPPLEMAAGSMIVGTVFLVTYAALSGGDIFAITPTFSSLGAILYLGLLSTACANLIYFHLVPRLGATRMAQINFAVPVGGALLGVLLLGEALTAQQFVALLLIVGSVYLGTSKSKHRGR